jgi:histidine ammonia-lyase
VLAIELHTAAQAREFHKTLRAGVGAEKAFTLIRKHLPPIRSDRYMGPELDKMHELVHAGAFVI